MSDDIQPVPPKRTSVDTRFKKGASGNPHGRPKGARNRSSLVDEIFNTPIPVTENGRQKIITKRAAALTQLANKAAGGDLRATKMLEEIYARHCKEKPLLSQTPSEPPPPTEPLTEEEAARRYTEALKKAKPDE